MTNECPKCQTNNPEDSKFCKECATPLEADVVHTKTLETPTVELTRGSVFADRYEIIEELGKGGMGKVYRVEDTKVKEEVALKLIKAEIAADKKTIERFRNELKIARKIRHKNVCAMFDLSEEKGSHFITMEYVSGGDLKKFIRRSGQMGIGKAISIAKQICEGLSEAHNMGIVHRDLKPNNIMIDDNGNARIMDFGIARSIRGKGITGSGVMIGTPEYMSPEQAEAKEVDQRSDIYSLGVILYEIVTGSVPFKGDTALSVALKHKSKLPPDPKKLNPKISEDLSRLILICMEKDRERRYQTAEALLSDLQNIEEALPLRTKIRPRRKTFVTTLIQKKLFIPTLTIIVLAIVAIMIWQIILQKRVVPTEADKPSVAVLPFEDLSPQKDQEYFCDGLAEELINRLINIENLRVPARTSAFSFKGKDKDIREIGEKLNVEMVLDGSVRKAGNKLRIAAQLVKAADGYPVWSKIYERNIEDTFALQDEISIAIIDNLKVRLFEKDKLKLTKRYTENIEAYDLYLQGRFFWNKRTEDGLKKAIEYFEQAIETDPNYAQAYAGTADSYNLLGIYSYLQPDEAYPVVKNAAQKALEIDETISEAHTSLASVFRYYDWNWEEAEKEFRRAIGLNPNYVTAHHWYALYLIIFSRFDEAIRKMKRAQELDPLSFIINTDLGGIFFYARQYDLAEKQSLKTLEMDPYFWKIYRQLGQIYIQKEMYKEAIAELNKSIKLNYNQRAHALMGYAWGMLNRRDHALRILDELHKLSKIKYVSAVSIAILYISLARKDEALKFLEKAYEEHEPLLTFIRVDPVFDTLRSDQRFKELIKKIGLGK